MLRKLDFAVTLGIAVFGMVCLVVQYQSSDAAARCRLAYADELLGRDRLNLARLQVDQVLNTSPYTAAYDAAFSFYTDHNQPAEAARVRSLQSRNCVMDGLGPVERANLQVAYLETLLKQGKPQQAEQQLRKVLRNAQSIELYDAVSRVLCDNGRARDAVSMWEERVRWAESANLSLPARADYYTRMAWASGTAGDLAKEEWARKHVTNVGLAICDAPRINSVAWFYATKGIQLAEAKRIAKRAIAIDPKNPGFRYTLAMAQSKSGEYSAAVNNLLVCIRKLGSSKDSNMRFLLGESYAGMGQNREAATELQEARRLGYDARAVDSALKNLSEVK